jgi:hypothetical protein
MNPTEHQSKQFDADLTALRTRVVEMAGLVDEQFRRAIEALTTGRTMLAEEVVAKDASVNALEVRIDDACAHLIAKRQPAASDLRMVLGVSKIVSELVGQLLSSLGRLSRLPFLGDLQLMPLPKKFLPSGRRHCRLHKYYNQRYQIPVCCIVRINTFAQQQIRLRLQIPVRGVL